MKKSELKSLIQEIINEMPFFTPEQISFLNDEGFEQVDDRHFYLGGGYVDGISVSSMGPDKDVFFVDYSSEYGDSRELFNGNWDDLVNWANKTRWGRYLSV